MGHWMSMGVPSLEKCWGLALPVAGGWCLSQSLGLQNEMNFALEFPLKMSVMCRDIIISTVVLAFSFLFISWGLRLVCVGMKGSEEAHVIFGWFGEWRSGGGWMVGGA